MESINQLAHKINQCTICIAELPFAPNPVIQLSNKSKILIIGQAPGKLAHETNTPFLDKSGGRLLEWLGVDKDQFYDAKNFAIMPMAFCYPGKNTNNSGDKKPPSICQKSWHDKVLSQLTNIELTLLVGQYAAKHYIDEFQGLTIAIQQNSIHNTDKIVLPHPSPRNNIWLAKNKWFETKTLPILRQRIKHVLVK